MRVSASIYNLAEDSTNEIIQSYLSLGGIFHVGIEFAGVEWSYGYCDKGSGVFAVEPRHCSLGPFKEQVHLGNVEMSVDEIIRILHKMRSEWNGPEYNILNRNCVVFSQEFLKRIDRKMHLPKYVVALTELGISIAGQGVASKVLQGKDEIFGSAEKELMWTEAESLMREFERDGKLTLSSYPTILHSRKPLPQLHNLQETQQICALSYYKVRYGNFEKYMQNSGIRHLLLNYRNR